MPFSVGLVLDIESLREGINLCVSITQRRAKQLNSMEVQEILYYHCTKFISLARQ